MTNLPPTRYKGIIYNSEKHVLVTLQLCEKKLMFNSGLLLVFLILADLGNTLPKASYATLWAQGSEHETGPMKVLKFKTQQTKQDTRQS